MVRPASAKLTSGFPVVLGIKLDATTLKSRSIVTSPRTNTRIASPISSVAAEDHSQAEPCGTECTYRR